MTPAARAALERSINGRLVACSADELRVVDEILIALERGRDRCGPLNVDIGPPLDPHAAIADSWCDYLIRVAADRVVRRRRIAEQLEEDALAEMRASTNTTATEGR